MNRSLSHKFALFLLIFFSPSGYDTSVLEIMSKDNKILSAMATIVKFG